MVMGRNIKIKNMRAFAILLVVLGHSIILYTGWGFIDTSRVIPNIGILKKFINILEMPLFMSISGFVFYFTMSKKNEFRSFIWNKIKRLLVPYIFVGAFWMAPIRMIMDVKGWRKGYLENICNNIILQRSTGHLWYLIALFLIFMISYWLIYFIKKMDNPCIVEILVLVSFFFISFAQKDGAWIHSENSIERTFLYLFWFFLGYLFNKYSGELFVLNICQKQIAGIISIFLFIFLFYLNIEKGSTLTYYGAAFFGVLALYICTPDKTNKYISAIDENSYGIYLFHSPMIYITFTFLAEKNPYIVVLINVLGLGAISMILTMIIRKTPLAFIIGEKYKKA